MILKHKKIALSPFVFLFLGLVLLVASSCTQCVTCSATWTDPVDSANTQVINSYEYCGSSKEVTEFQEAWGAQYNNDTIYSNVSCE